MNELQALRHRICEMWVSSSNNSKLCLTKLRSRLLDANGLPNNLTFIHILIELTLLSHFSVYPFKIHNYTKNITSVGI